MKTRILFATVLLAAAAFGAANGQTASAFGTLLDGTKGMENFNQAGNANWRAMDGAIGANLGNGFLVSKESYGDFRLRAEVYTDNPDANSGIFIRCQNPNNIGGASCYEVNVFDNRPGGEYATGSIVNVAKKIGNPRSAGQWGVLEIIAKGPQMTIMWNGVKSAEASDAKFPQGRFALQYGSGTVKFRKVEVSRN
jgi:hypothetical protein